MIYHNLHFLKADKCISADGLPFSLPPPPPPPAAWEPSDRHNQCFLLTCCSMKTSCHNYCQKKMFFGLTNLNISPSRGHVTLQQHLLVYHLEQENRFLQTNILSTVYIDPNIDPTCGQESFCCPYGPRNTSFLSPFYPVSSSINYSKGALDPLQNPVPNNSYSYMIHNL